jgi:TolA-binding protein
LARKSKYAVGIFEDGQNLYVASLVKEDGQVQVVSTEIYDIHELKDMDDETYYEGTDSAEELLEKEAEMQSKKQPKPEDMQLSDDDLQLTVGDDDLKLDDEVLSGLQHDVVSTSTQENPEDILLPGLKDDSFKNYPELLYRIINRTPGSAELAFTFQEPKVYYTNFYSDWGLDGAKLRQKVIQELSTEQSDFGVRIPDSVGIIRSASGELITVASDVVSDFKSITHEYEAKFSKHLPHIAFIESDIVSIVNLMNLNYDFTDEEISVIIYVGEDHSRLIFMQGNKLLHISPVVNEGTDSILIFETIYNKIMLEQDSLNLQKIDRVFTAGQAGEMGVKAYLSSMFPSESQKTVEDIQLQNLVVYDTNKFSDEKLAPFTIPIGAAWRILEKKNESLIDVDLTPPKLRERQKILKLGVAGWAIIAVIFLLTWYFSWQISSLRHEITSKKNDITLKQQELEYLQSLDQQLTKANEKLENFKKTYSVLDSMLSRTKDYNKFLYNVSRQAKYYGGIWIAEMAHKGEKEVELKGYALYRTRIADFSDAIGATILRQVETSEIREKTVYHFQISCTVPYKDKYAKQEIIEAAVKKRIAEKEKEKERLEKEKQERENAKKILAEQPKAQDQVPVAANNPKKENKPVVNKPKVQTKNVAASKPAGNRNQKKTVTIKNEQEFQNKYDQARQLFNAYDYSGAIKIFSELIDSGFNSKLLVNCYYWKGEGYFGIKDYDNAIESLKYVARRQSGKKSAALYMIGRAYAAKGDYKTSEFYMNQVINYYPNEPLARKASEFKRKLR